nr:MAG TPA: hypothetical protein [Caudoviricetes sp.]
MTHFVTPENKMSPVTPAWNKRALTSKGIWHIF